MKSTEFIGTVEQSLTLLGSSFTVYDAIKNPLCFIKGPNVYSCCMYKEVIFQVSFNNNFFMNNYSSLK